MGAALHWYNPASPHTRPFPPLLAHTRLNPTRNKIQLLNQELLNSWPKGQGEEGGCNSPCVAMKWLDLW